MENAAGWTGKTLIATEGRPVGTVIDVLFDQTGDAEWLAIDTGETLRSWRRFVPVRRAVNNGGDVVVPFEEEQVRNAPAVTPVNGVFTWEDRALLVDHYGVHAEAGLTSHR